jgi:N6-adenosine-specific RNA methylase IME4
MTKYKKHRFNIYPEMQPEEFERIRSNLFANGYDKRYPIWLFEGEIIDGWNRYRACEALGIEPHVQHFQGSAIDAMQLVIRSNDRRDLNSSQRAAIAVEAEEVVAMLKAEAKAKQAEFHGNQYKSAVVEKIPQVQSNPEQNKVRTQLAETFGTNPRYVSDAARLKEQNPEAFKQVLTGAKTISEVKKEEKVRERKELIEKQVKDIEEGKLPELSGVYDIVSIDPPWPYGREYDPEGSRAANPYPEMSIEQISQIELPVSSDSVLFLWTTHRFLPDSFELMKGWGFEYKATMVWNKQKIGMGAWFRMQCEFCLVGVKGKPFWQNTRYNEVINEPRREHSRKPDGFFDLVNEICTGRKLEYFSREARPGWDIFGNDTNKF